MQHKRRSVGFILAILCTFTLLLAACRTGTSTTYRATTQRAARLDLRETPGAVDTATPGTMTPGTMPPGTMPATPTVYVGQIPNERAWIGLSTTGKRMVAFVTDGSKDHPPTFAQWFRSSVANGTVDATATAKNGTDRLQAMLTNDTATGTVTFSSGKSLAFTANAVPTADQTAGLYRGEHMVNNQRYVAGWIILPTTGATGTATPIATETGTTVPPMIGSPTLTATGTLTPSATSTTMPPFIGSPTPSVTETTTPSATSTLTPGTLQEGGAVLNEQNYTVQSVPELTQEQIQAKQVAIPNLATFKLVLCGQNLC